MKKKQMRKKLEANSKEKETYSDEEMLDLSKELHPLSHYVDNEDDLVVQLFATIKQTKLQSMLPPLLKEIDLKELQNLCLHELRGMSRKRILSAINGQHMSSSSSDEFEDEPKKAEPNGALSKFQPTLKPKDDAPPQNQSEDSNPDRLRTPPPPPLQLPPQSNDEQEESSQMNNLSALDILELEMRAKLIKTMLEKQPNDDDVEGDEEALAALLATENMPMMSPSQIKQEPTSPDIIIKEEIKSPIRSSSRDSCQSPRKNRSRSVSKSSFSSRSLSTSRSRSWSSSKSSSLSDDKDHGTSPNHHKSSENKKKRITKREFQERMKKAKLNRRYRKRKNSETDSEDEEGGNRSRRGRRRDRELRRRASWEIEYFERLKKESKKEEPLASKETSKQDNADNNNDVEEGEYESKEEGEIEESGEEREHRELPQEVELEEEEVEEGACTPSDEEKSSTVIKAIVDGEFKKEDSASPSPRRHSKSRKKRRKKSSARHSRSRSKTPPLLQKIRRTKKLPKKEIPEQILSPHVESLIPQEFNSKLNIKEDIKWVSSKHTEPIESDEIIEDETSNEPKEPSIPIFTKSISFSIGKKSLSSNKKGKDSNENSSEVNNVVSSLTEVTVAEAQKNPETRGAHKSSWSSSKFELPEEEIRYVVPCLEMPSSNPPQDTKDLNLLFTDWEDLPHGDDFTADNSNDQSMQSLPEASDNCNLEKMEEDSQNTADLPAMDSQSNSNIESEEPSTPKETLTESNDPPQPSMDIIGVIEPKNDSNTEFDEQLIGGSSWSSRWLQSEKVQNVVSNSKILSKVRKKIQEKGKDKTKEKVRETSEEPTTKMHSISKPELPVVETKPIITYKPKPPNTSSASVIGSIEEYEKLIGLKVSSGAREDEAMQQHIAKSSSVLDSDDDDDSEEEALWSKIMKK